MGTKEDKRFQCHLNVGHCIFCAQCVDSCRKGCLHFSQDIELGALHKDELGGCDGMSWQDELAGYMAGASKTVVLGAGSVLCGDDAAGMLVVELIQKAIGENTDCLLPLAGSTAPENFSGVIRDYPAGFGFFD